MRAPSATAKTVADAASIRPVDRAFASFMKVAVANRPITKFETDVPLPDWQLEPDEEALNSAIPDEGIGAPLVDANGNPVGTPSGESQGIPVPSQTGGPDQSELDRIFNGPPPQREPPREPQRQPPPPPRSEPPADPLQPRPEQPQG